MFHTVTWGMYYLLSFSKMRRLMVMFFGMGEQKLYQLKPRSTFNLVQQVFTDHLLCAKQHPSATVNI